MFVGWFGRMRTGVYTAPHPLGPWRKQAGPVADLGCIANSSNPTPAEQRSLPLTAEPSPGQGCNYHNAIAASVSRAQQKVVLPIHTKTGTVYVWTGDRWMQAPDGKKAHEPQFWAPLSFEADGTLQPLKWVYSFQITGMVLPKLRAVAAAAQREESTRDDKYGHLYR